MTGLTRILLVLLVVLIGGVGAFLATWDIPAPVAPVEKVIPNEQFPR
jgi:cell division septal protein FtsQ